MTPEQQNIEYKSSWHDDYLKWICGFANTQGGKIYIDNKEHPANNAVKANKRVRIFGIVLIFMNIERR